MDPERLQDAIRDWWDADAASYDAAPGHAMSDPVEATAWSAALSALLPHPPAEVLDVGAGTGSLSLAAAALGHRVTALDLSTRMLEVAERRAAAAGAELTFVHAPADRLPGGPFDAVIERHVTWTLPDPVGALARWREVTTPGGVLVMFEGSWGGEGALVAAKDRLASALRTLRGTSADDHHAPYPRAIVGAAPLAGLRSAGPYVDAVRAAGWTGVQLFRLRDVERAIAARTPAPLGWLEHRPRYAIVAAA